MPHLCHFVALPATPPATHLPHVTSACRLHPCTIAAVKKLLAENNLPHLLFYGPPGTGKTSTILAIARQIYGPAMASMTLELNASGEGRCSAVWCWVGQLVKCSVWAGGRGRAVLGRLRARLLLGW